VKIALVVGSYAASAVGAYLCERRGWGVVSDTLLLLSGFLLLGGLALISQIFHIQGSPTGLLMTWLLVWMPTFLLARGTAIYALYEIVALVYMNMLYLRSSFWWRGIDTPRGLSALVTPYQPLALLLLLAAAAWGSWFLERNALGRDAARAPESMLRAVFVGGSTRKIFLSNFFFLNWFTWLCIVNSTHEGVLPYVMGILVIGALISLSAWKLDAGDLDLQGLLCVGAAGFALTFRFAWWWRLGYYGYGAAADPYLREVILFRQILSSAALGVYLLWRVARRRRYAAFSVFLFCAVLARWYFDMFYNFMSKSLFFTLGGLLLILIAFACHLWNKRGKSRKAAAGSEGGHDGDAVV
jgi:uncharacterized membrane protein